MKENIHNKSNLVIITGSTGGLGKEFADFFAEKKYNLLLIAKDAEKLKEQNEELKNRYNIRTDCLTIDLSSMNEINAFDTYLENNNIDIEIFINNAATGVLGRFEDTEWNRELELINTNITALTYLTKSVLKRMLKKGSGKILNIASTAAFKPGPLMSVYNASKAYVLMFSAAIAREIKNTGISLTVLCPGPTWTKFLEKSSEDIIKINYNNMADPKDVVSYAYKALQKKKFVAVHGFGNNINSIIFKFIPMKILTDMMYRIRKNNLNK